MLTYEHSIETSASTTAIWRVWSDVDAWGTWNPDIEKVEIDSPFAADEIGPQLGPAITADFPDTMAALVARAQR